MTNNLKDATDAVARVDAMLGGTTTAAPIVAQAYTQQELALARSLDVPAAILRKDPRTVRSVYVESLERIVRLRVPDTGHSLYSRLLNGAAIPVLLRNDVSRTATDTCKRKRETISGRLSFDGERLRFERVTRK